MKIRNKNNGITLIALVITIIVMLILVAVTISMAVNGGLFDYAGKAVGETQNTINEEQQIADGKIQVDGKWYASIEDYIAGKEIKEPLIITSETEGVVYTDKDGNAKQLTDEVEDGDIIKYGDYEYRYNMYREVNQADIDSWWAENTSQNGWGVWLTDWRVEEPGEICNEILGETVNNMNGTFYDSAVKTAPEIPDNIRYLRLTFVGSGVLKGTIKINASNITDFYGAFAGIANEVTIQVPANSTTYETLYDAYGDSENITIETF